MKEILWKRTIDCVSSQIEDSLVLLDLEGGSYYTLNRTAADLWEGMVEPVSEESLVQILMKKYRVTPEACARSVRRLLEDLSAKGLAKPVD